MSQEDVLSPFQSLEYEQTEMHSFDRIEKGNIRHLEGTV
jgi:hypothetical protein